MKIRKFIAVFLAGIAVQAAIYLYLDQVLFAPTSDFQIGGTNQQEAMGEGTEPNGRSFYSYDKRFMATIVDDRVTIYERRAIPSASISTAVKFLSLNGCPTATWLFSLPMAATGKSASTASTSPSTTRFIRTANSIRLSKTHRSTARLPMSLIRQRPMSFT